MVDVGNDKPPMVIWHADCLDGFTSAWIANRSAGKLKCEFVPGYYDKPPPDVTGRNVVMVDFSYKREQIVRMRNDARSILILDHHKTAMDQLAPYLAPPDLKWPYFPAPGECVAFFDMKRSGAGLCWDFFFPDLPRPMLVNYVEDRDLWKFEQDETRAITAVLYSHQMEFLIWDALAMQLETVAGRLDMTREGKGLLRAAAKERMQLIENGLRMMKLGGIIMPTINAPWYHASEIGNEVAVAKHNLVGCCAIYSDNKNGRRIFSLRSTDAGPDVSAIAASYGGGGHRNAAGFSMPVGWEGE